MLIVGLLIIPLNILCPIALASLIENTIGGHRTIFITDKFNHKFSTKASLK